ncbi:MAG TPA: hypothetical protein VGJ73_02105 [Verrucomicrobiae bacterium]|jgi:hypothetical protein
MQSFRFLAVFVATNLAGSALLAHADDTPAQAAARAALEQQMTQMDNGQSPGATNSMTTTPPAAPAPSTPPPVSAPTPQFSTNVPMNSATESETAPSGMSQKSEPATAPMQSQTNAGAMTMTVPASVLNTNETEQYPVNPPMAPMGMPQTEAPSTQPAAAAPAHPVAVPASGPGNQWPTAGQPNPDAQQLPPAVANGSGPGMSASSIQNEQGMTNAAPAFAPIAAPPLPLSQDKQAELRSLLSQYMSNQITPTQYQEQRAKILAEP